MTTGVLLLLVLAAFPAISLLVAIFVMLMLGGFDSLKLLFRFRGNQ